MSNRNMITLRIQSFNKRLPWWCQFWLRGRILHCLVRVLVLRNTTERSITLKWQVCIWTRMRCKFQMVMWPLLPDYLKKTNEIGAKSSNTEAKNMHSKTWQEFRLQVMQTSIIWREKVSHHHNWREWRHVEHNLSFLDMANKILH